MKRESYFSIDHRAAPAHGVPAGMLFESGCVTCRHCQTLVVLNPLRERPRNYCRKCDSYICDGCAHAAHSTGEHKSFAESFDEAVEAAHRGASQGT